MLKTAMVNRLFLLPFFDKFRRLYWSKHIQVSELLVAFTQTCICIFILLLCRLWTYCMALQTSTIYSVHGIMMERWLVDLSKFDNNNENQVRNSYLIWLFVYLGIGFAISVILPFPMSIGVILLVLFLLNIVRTEIALRKKGMGGIKGLYKSSSFSFRHGIGNGLVYTPLKFFCMNCGYEHRKIACPKCGTKAVRAGWYLAPSEVQVWKTFSQVWKAKFAEIGQEWLTKSMILSGLQDDGTWKHTNQAFWNALYCRKGNRLKV